MTAIGMRVWAKLTPKEQAVLVALCEGRTNKEIGDKLGNSEQLIKNRVRDLFDKTGQDSRWTLMVFAFQHGLVMCPCRCARMVEETVSDYVRAFVSAP